MICHRCLLRAVSRRNATLTLGRHQNFSTRSANRQEAETAQTTTATNPRPHGRPAATSTSAAQPFSEPFFPTPEKNVDFHEPRMHPAKDKVLPASSVAAGTVLKGLNFMKNSQDPVAMEDGEYPAWLWQVLNQKGEKEGMGVGGDEGDLFSKSKKQRRKAAKALRKQQLQNPDMLQPKIPLYEQSIDLPAGDGTLAGAMGAGEAREELTKAMRDERRRKIKEDNFLKAMG